MEIPAKDPGVRNDITRSWVGHDPHEHCEGAEEGEPYGSKGNAASKVMGIPMTKQPIHEDGKKGEHWNEYDEKFCHVTTSTN